MKIEENKSQYIWMSYISNQVAYMRKLSIHIRGVRTCVNSLLDSYSIDKVKKLYSAIYVDGLTVSLLII